MLITNNFRDYTAFAHKKGEKQEPKKSSKKVTLKRDIDELTHRIELDHLQNDDDLILMLGGVE